MSLAVCKDCSARYAPSLDRCPHCKSTERTEGVSEPLLPYLDVACSTSGCPALGAERRVYPRQAAPGVLEVPTYACARCAGVMVALRTWKYRPDEEGEEQENPMAKITVHTGASNAAEPDPDDTPAPAAAEDTQAPAGDVDQGEDTASPSAAGGPDTAEPAAVTRPSKSASKAEWVEFAQHINRQNEIADVDPETLTKAELIDLYGDQE